jgi:hypothetical protein
MKEGQQARQLKWPIFRLRMQGALFGIQLGEQVRYVLDHPPVIDPVHLIAIARGLSFDFRAPVAHDALVRPSSPRGQFRLRGKVPVQRLEHTRAGGRRPPQLAASFIIGSAANQSGSIIAMACVAAATAAAIAAYRLHAAEAAFAARRLLYQLSYDGNLVRAAASALHGRLF